MLINKEWTDYVILQLILPKSLLQILQLVLVLETGR